MKEADLLKQELVWNLASERDDAMARLTRMQVLPFDACLNTSCVIFVCVLIDLIALSSSFRMRLMT